MPGNRAVASYVKLVRLKIVALVVFTMVMAAWIAGGGAPAWRDATHLIVGTTFVILGSLVLNHRLERRADGIMARTAERPLSRGRMTGTQALVVGCAGAAGGLVYLAVACGFVFAGLAALACLLYVVVYTLLKPLTPWQTPIGALAGALPVLMGAALGSDVGSVMSTTLFGIAYFWQFPHAMAIAWLYRSEYALAGVKVAPVVDPTGRLAGWIAAGGAAALLATSLAPSVAQLRGWPYGVVAATLGTAYLLVSLHFLVARNDRAARRLFRASLVCLPVLLIALSVTGP